MSHCAYLDRPTPIRPDFFTTSERTRFVNHSLTTRGLSLFPMNGQVANLLWCAFTLEFVQAGPFEEQMWIALQCLSATILVVSSIVAFIRRPFMLGDMPL